jgi:hypothetical protein
MVKRLIPQPAGGAPMNAQNDNTNPPRFGMRRVIAPWEYRHLRAFARVRFAAGFFLAGFGLGALALSYGWIQAGLQPAEHRTVIYALAAALLAAAAGNFAFGYWELTIARSSPAQT